MKTIGDDKSVVSSYRLCMWVGDCSHENGTIRETQCSLLVYKIHQTWCYASGIIMCVYMCDFSFLSVFLNSEDFCDPSFAEIMS